MEEQNPIPEKKNRFPNWLITVTPISKILAMVLFITLPFLGFYLGMQYQQKVTVSTPVVSEVQKITPTSTSTPTIGKCTLGLIPKDSYLDNYIVKPGDTILSIARNELGDVSRVNELIALNTKKYPSVSIQTPFIEQGWSLYLPPKTINKSSGTIAAINGEVIRKEDIYWWLKTRTINSQQGDFPLILDNSTKMIGIQSLHIGDCVKVIYDANNPQGTTALLISGQ